MCRRLIAAGAPWCEAHAITLPATNYLAGDDLCTPYQRPTGLPIDNLTSQHFANRYLSPVDHFIKERLRVRPYPTRRAIVPVFSRAKS